MSTTVALALEQGERDLRLTCVPLLGVGDDLTAIVFEAGDRRAVDASPEEPSNPPRQQDMERELQHMREDHQRARERLRGTNEELRSVNEELQSNNEELRSTNEELESSKEEQQSLNEELISVNGELQTKIAELGRIHGDMRNLLNSIQVPTLFLDNSLAIKRYSTEARLVFNLIQGDVGRPVEHTTSKLEYTDLVPDAIRVLETLEVFSREVRTTTGDWYRMQIRPYRTMDNVIDGVVVTFFDVTSDKASRAEADRLNRELEAARLLVQTKLDRLEHD
ncbi:MAG: two-component system CheB/CheR fusion protein [Myxococcota bacterium]